MWTPVLDQTLGPRERCAHTFECTSPLDQLGSFEEPEVDIRLFKRYDTSEESYTEPEIFCPSELEVSYDSDNITDKELNVQQSLFGCVIGIDSRFSMKDLALLQREEKRQKFHIVDIKEDKEDTLQDDSKKALSEEEPPIKLLPGEELDYDDRRVLLRSKLKIKDKLNESPGCHPGCRNRMDGFGNFDFSDVSSTCRAMSPIERFQLALTNERKLKDRRHIPRIACNLDQEFHDNEHRLEAVGFSFMLYD